MRKIQIIFTTLITILITGGIILASTSFPTSLDNLPTVETGDVITASGWNDIVGAINALEQKIGIDNSTDTSSLDYLVKTHAQPSQLTVSGTTTLSSLTNGFLKVDANGQVSTSTIDISDDTNLTASSPLSLSGDTIQIDTSGDWTGTLDGYEGADFLLKAGGTMTGDLTVSATTTLATTTFSNLANGFLKLDANGKVSTSTIDISDYTNLAVSGTLLNLTGDTLSVNEGTLTDGKLCKYVAGTGLVCDYTDQDTTYTAGGTLLQLSGTEFSIKEGTLTSGKICKYDSTNGLVCDYDDQNTTYTAGGTLLQLSGTEFSVKEGTLTSGKLCKYDSTSGLVCDYTDQDTTYSAGTGLDLTGTTFSLSHLGLESLTDPNANRLYYWNDTNNTTEWLDYSNWDTDKTDDLTTATTFSGDISGTYNNLAIGDDKVTEADLKVVNSPTDEYCLTYEATGGDFEWQSCGTGGSEWTDAGTFLYPTETTDSVLIGTSTQATSTNIFESYGKSYFYNSGVPLDIQNTTDAASNQVAIFRANNRATAADNDQGYISFYGDDDLGNSVEFARITWEMDDVTNNSKDSTLYLKTMSNNSLVTSLKGVGSYVYIGETGTGHLLTGNTQIAGYLNITGSEGLIGGWSLRDSDYTLIKAVLLDSDSSISANYSASGMLFRPRFSEASSGNHPLIAGVAIQPTTIDAGSATVSDTASLYIEDAATTTVVSGDNYALWVDAGKTRLDGDLQLGLTNGILKVDANGNVSAGTVDISDNTNLSAGRSLTLNGDTIDADAELYQKTLSFDWLGVDASKELKYKVRNAITINKIYCNSVNGTTTISLFERTLDSPDSGGSAILSSSLTCGNGAGVASTTSFSDSAIAADAIIAATSTIDGTPDCYIFIDYTIND